jgi:MFS family permease
MTTIEAKRVILPLGLGTAFSLLGDATLYTVLPTHTAEIGISLAGVGILLGINRAVRILLNGPAGLIYDRFPRRGLFISALFLGAFSTALYALNSGFWLLFFGRVLWGVSWSFIWVGGTRIILDVANDQDRGHWMGLYQTWFFLGTAIGFLVGGILTDQIGYTATMWTGAILTALGAGIALIFLPETRQPHPASYGQPVIGKFPTPDLKNGLMSAASIYGVNRFVTAGVLAATLGLLVKEQMELHQLGFGLASVTGILMALRTFVSMFASVTSGKASDWLGSRWRVALWGLGIGAFGMALLIWNLPIALVTGIVLSAFAAGSLQTVSSALPGDIVGPRQQGVAIGFIHTAGDIGSAVGPPVAYALLPSFGLSGIYLLCAGLFLLQMIPVFRRSMKRKSISLAANTPKGPDSGNISSIR